MYFFLKRWWNRLLKRFNKLPSPKLKVEPVTVMPNKSQVHDGVVYLVGNIESGILKWAVLKCPCHCGDLILLSLLKKRYPSWIVQVNVSMEPTLTPSIRRNEACYSHFWLQNGNIKWCSDTSIRNSK